MRLSTSPIPSPFSFQLERASDRRWIFSVLMSPGATDNMDSDLSASLGHHCGTKSLLLSGLPPLILCSKRNSKRTCSNSFVPCSFFFWFFACISCLHFCLVFYSIYFCIVKRFDQLWKGAIVSIVYVCMYVYQRHSTYGNHPMEGEDLGDLEQSGQTSSKGISFTWDLVGQ